MRRGGACTDAPPPPAFKKKKTLLDALKERGDAAPVEGNKTAAELEGDK